MTNHIAPTIEDLIQQANDPNDRAMLVVLNKMATSLDANTRLTDAVSTRLEEHITAFQLKVEADEALKNKGMGAWKVLAWMLGVAQIVVGWGFFQMRAEADRVMTAVGTHAASDAALRMELVTIANNAATADLRQANRMDLIESRCARYENGKAGK